MELCTIVLVLISAGCSPAFAQNAPTKGGTYVDGATGAIVQRMSDLPADWKALKTAQPTRPPANQPYPNPGDLDWMLADPQHGATNGYAKFSCVNSTGEYYLAFSSQPYIYVYRMSDLSFGGALAWTESNAILEQWTPRWDRRPGQETRIVFAPTEQSLVYSQDAVGGVATRKTLGSVAPYTIKDSGQEGDVSVNGKIYPVKLVDAAGVVWCGLFDLDAGKLAPARVAGDPNAIGVSPNGKWLAFLPHTGDNRFVSADGTRVAMLDSALAGGEKNIAHNGWARTAGGVDVFVYQDTQDDGLKLFDPEAGKSATILNVCQKLDCPDLHLAAGPPGWCLMSTYGSIHPDFALNHSLLLIELATGQIRQVATTRTAHLGYSTEAYASVDPWGKYIYWGSNFDGKTHLDLVRTAMPALGTAPAPTPTPTPAPIAQPVVVKPVAPPARGTSYALMAWYDYGTTHGWRLIGTLYVSVEEAKAAAGKLGASYRWPVVLEIPGG